MTQKFHKKNPTAISEKRAVGELIISGAIWGFGFIATMFALKDMGPLTMVVVRFVIAVAVTLPFLYFSTSLRSVKHWAALKMAFWPGMMLALLMILQTWGLKYTSPTKSSFITTLYIVFVPLIESLFLKRRVVLSHYIFVVVALVGTGFICNFHAGDWNLGDLLTLGCSLAAAFHIIFVGHVSHRIDSSVVFNTYQSFWAILLPAMFLILFPEELKWPWSPVGLFGLAWLVFGSTIVAFMLQIRAQKVLSPSLASLLFLLESPFAAFFAFVILDDRLSAIQWLGAVLITIAAFGVVRTETKIKLS
jgi:drug/metabolite transporter (DMT)-like permease